MNKKAMIILGSVLVLWPVVLLEIYFYWIITRTYFVPNSYLLWTAIMSLIVGLILVLKKWD